VLRVREMASGQVRPWGRSTPRGRGGNEEEFEGGGIGRDGGGTGRPFVGRGGG
jgi:hypothetical protein